jgi:hypothetical protein
MKVKSIVFFGTFGPPSLTIARSFHTMGISVYLMTPGPPGAVPTAPSSCFAGASMLDGRAVGSPEGMESVVNYVRKVGAQAVATLAELNCLWLARNRARFPGDCKVLLPPIKCLELLASKATQIRLAREAGFAVLPTYPIKTAADVVPIDASAYPLCLRPAAADAVKPAFKVRLARSPEELLAELRGMTILEEGLLAQPFRVLPNMVVHCASREGGDLMHADAFLADRKFEGLALRIRPMELPSGLADKIRNFSGLTALSGVYHFDFLHCPRTGESYYLEVNTRFGGTTDKVRWLGVDEAAHALQAYGLEPPRSPRRIPSARAAVTNKRATVKHLLAMLRRGGEPWDYPQESRLSAVVHSLGDLLLAKDSIFDWRDLRGTLAFHLQGIRG